MKKRMYIMLISLGILFGLIFLYKIAMMMLFKHFMAEYASPTVTVSAMKADYSLWQPQINASASLRAVRGVNVTSEMAGMVQTIYFTPGSVVKKDTVLVQLNADSDIAQLNSLQASADLAKTIYQRDKAQYAIRAISKATLDTDAADLKSKQAQVAEQAAVVAKKTIRAPFSGRLGISAINPGQYINPGDKIVTLQQLDPMYVDFYVPQQNLVNVKTGQSVMLKTDAFPNQLFNGSISTIDPLVDVNTRNVEVEATIANPQFNLTPGMFATVTAQTGAPQRYLTLPQTAISFNPYGDVVYIVKTSDKKDKEGKPVLTVMQSFVTTGETRGDQIAILTGLKAGDMVVTSGQLKLKNGSMVAINNSVAPSNNPAPSAVDE
jgi:membrane fusion protein, multidrug efflux system